MGGKRRIENSFNPGKSKTTFSRGGGSAGVRDNWAVRQNISTKGGQVVLTPVDDIDIANKKYVDDGDAAVELTTIQVFNNTGSQLDAGCAVYMTGWNVGLGLFQVALADADDSAKMPAIGLVQTNIGIAQQGQIIMQGELHGINTTSFSQDDELWVDTTAGALTATRPSGVTTAVQKVAQVSNVNASGTLLVFGAGRSNDVPNITKGSIRSGAASGAPTNLAVGANDTVLTADSGETTGLKWAAAGGGVNNLSKHITIESPTASEDFGGIHFPAAVTITEVVAVVVGSSTPSVTIEPQHNTDRSAAGNNVLSSATAITNTTTGQTLTGFDDATLPADSWLWLETTAQSGTVNSLHVTFVYTED